MKVSISGIRGIYGDEDLSLHQVVKFAKSFAYLVTTAGNRSSESSSKPATKCVLARDTRPSGRIIAQTVASALMSSGIDVYNLGVAPTPAAFRESRKAGAGVIVTASHNPLEWNGLKFLLDGRGLFEGELETLLKSQAIHQGRFGSEFEAVSNYVEDIADLVSHQQGPAEVRVGIDSGGGAGCGYSEQLFKRLGYSHYSINGVPGVSSRGPDPTADGLQDLRSLVKANRLDYGFALDLDADRLVVVSGDGEKLNPDSTLLLCIARSIEMGMKKFVTSIDTSVAVDKFVRGRGGVVVHSKVGEANVVSKMLEAGADAGGEGSSAGFIMPKFNMCRDGLLAAATIATLDKKTVRECLELASQFAQVRSKIAVDSSMHRAVIDRLPDVLRQESSSEIMTEDGVKAVIDEDSWVLVRPSNTEHAIRVSVESRAEKAEALYQRMSEKVQRAYEQASNK